MITKDQQPTVLLQDELGIENLTKGTQLMERALSVVLEEYNKLKLPHNMSIQGLFDLEDAEIHMKKVIEENLNDSDLQVNGLKINRKKLSELIELPNCRNLNSALLALRQLVKNYPECKNPRFYTLENFQITINNTEVQSAIDRKKVFATTAQEKFLEAVESISEVFNNKLAPVVPYRLMDQNALHPTRKRVDFNRLFSQVFDWHPTECRLTVKRKFIADNI